MVAAGFMACVATCGAGAVQLEPWREAVAPPLALDRLDGKAVELSRLRDKPVIVHFFATWCAPCIEEMASLDAFAGRMDGKVAVIAVDVGEVDARVRNFFRQRPVRFPILLDRNRSAMKLWRVEGLPTSFVLGRGLRPLLTTEKPLDWSSPPVRAALEVVTGDDAHITGDSDSRGGMTR